MDFERHSNKMQHHTTTIVLSTHKSSITSPALAVNPIQSPPVSPPTQKERRERREERKKEKERKKESRTHNKDNNNNNNKNVITIITRLYRLPKPILSMICNYLSFEDLFICTSVCRKMSRKFLRMLTDHKQCSTVEKADIKILSDPISFITGVTFYRVPSDNINHINNNNNNENNEGGFKMFSMSYLRNNIDNKNNNMDNKINKTNAVAHKDLGQVAHHLKQLEHRLIYNTVNGNEVVRVANNWIFFNRKLFIKISDQITDENTTTAEDDRLYLVDIILVEANLCRKARPSFFGMNGSTSGETFCQITMDNLNLRTSVSSLESDPVWNEDCSFTVRKNTTNKMQITMLESGKLRHTKLGNVEINLKDLACDVLHDIWQPVQPIQDGFSGKFHVLIHKSRVPKKEVDTRNLGILGYNGSICETVPIRLEFGDVILISNSEFYTHIAKLGTMSVWDHVAIVVERKGELHLFESSPDGVFTTPINRRLKFYLRGSTLGVRRLTVTRTPEMKKQLKHFIKEVDGRPYKQNWMDLVRAWQGSHTSEDLDSIFCSELVAAAYKRMGLLDNKISSNNFLPVDFALPNNSKVKLINGRLEKIRNIYLS